MNKNILIVAAVICIIGIGILGEYVPRVEIQKKGEDVLITKEQPVQIANPASQACVAYGYLVKIEKDDTGNEWGFCVFPDGTRCDEWEFFRGECGNEWKKGEKEQMPFIDDGAQKIPDGRYAGCPEWVNCMPGPDRPINHCDVPPECEGYTQRAY